MHWSPPELSSLLLVLEVALVGAIFVPNMLELISANRIELARIRLPERIRQLRER